MDRIDVLEAMINHNAAIGYYPPEHAEHETGCVVAWNEGEVERRERIAPHVAEAIIKPFPKGFLDCFDTADGMDCYAIFHGERFRAYKQLAAWKANRRFATSITIMKAAE